MMVVVVWAGWCLWGSWVSGRWFVYQVGCACVCVVDLAGEILCKKGKVARVAGKDSILHNIQHPILGAPLGCNKLLCVWFLPWLAHFCSNCRDSWILISILFRQIFATSWSVMSSKNTSRTKSPQNTNYFLFQPGKLVFFQSVLVTLRILYTVYFTCVWCF